MMLRRAWWLALALVLAGCPEPVPVEEEDAGVEPYDGPTQSSVIPTFDPDAIDAGDPIIDAGMVTIDTRCCDTQFAITDEEPADAVGLLEGQHTLFGAGLPLTRSDAGWSVAACFPLNASAFYWYRFTWDGGVFDAGTTDLEDGGQETLLVPVTGESLRASASEPGFTDADGVRRNYYRAVESCDGLDGAVP
ncbi:MAG: hypothetical protein Q8K32_28665 [Archangium sp.]|nr:hypothetical protein [Archangium sp.]